jgi:hypothetical protein
MVCGVGQICPSLLSALPRQLDGARKTEQTALAELAQVRKALGGGGGARSMHAHIGVSQSTHAF